MRHFNVETVAGHDRSREDLVLAARTSAPDAGEPFPLQLHRQARQTVRAHAQRELRRFGVLVGVDISVLLAFRALLRQVREAEVFGPFAATVANRLLPVHDIHLAPTLSAVLLGLFVFGTYRAGDRRRDPYAICAGAALGLGLVWWARVWTDPSGWTFAGFAIASTVLGAALILTRFGLDAVVRRLRPVGANAARTLLIGTPEHARRAMSNPALADTAESIIVGSIDLMRRPLAGGGGKLIRLVAAERVDTIVLLGHADEALANYVLEVADAACCRVYRIPDECVSGEYAPSLYWRRGVPMLQLTRPASRGHQLAVKQFIDTSVAAAAMLIMSPVLAAIAIAVGLGSRGPILFRQERVGMGGRRFTMYKFRTMVADAEERRKTLREQSVYTDDRLFKVPNDPRVTPVGRFLRRTSLDELPQFWNVLRGDMSLVGPRPPLPCEVELYDEHHYRRFVMKPGITGPWQVNGRNKVTDFEEVVRIEDAYMRNWSLGKDFRIIARTLPVVLRMEGAH